MCSTMSQRAAAASATAPVTSSGNPSSRRTRLRALTFGRSQNFASAGAQYPSGRSRGRLAQARRGRRTMAYREGGGANRETPPSLRDRDDRLANPEKIATATTARPHPAAEAARRTAAAEAASRAPIAAAITHSAIPLHTTAGTLAARTVKGRSLGSGASQSRCRWIASRLLRRRATVPNTTAEAAVTRMGAAAADASNPRTSATRPSPAPAARTRAPPNPSSGQRRTRLQHTNQPLRSAGSF